MRGAVADSSDEATPETPDGWRSLPRHTPRWLIRRPQLLVTWLSWVNLYRRHRVLWLVSAALLGALVWVSSTRAFASLIAYCSQDFGQVLLALVALAVSSMSVGRRKARIAADRSQSWLTALPVGLSARAQLLVAPLAQLVVLAFVLVACWATTPIPFRSIASVWLTVLAGLAVGPFVPWNVLLMYRSRPEPWRRAIVRARRARWATDPRLTPLSYWAVAQGRVNFNPRMIAAAFLPVLLANPMGQVDMKTVTGAASWGLSLYLLSQLAAMLRSVFPAAWWLAPTPLPFARFAVFMSYRAVLTLVSVWSVAIFFIAALSNPYVATRAGALAVLWIVAFIAVTLGACKVATAPSSTLGARLHGWLT